MIYYIIGIRRSGLHAIANWLFPMTGEFIYLNNYELGKLTDIEMVVNGNFNVIIGIENKPLDEILKYCNKGKRIWVSRNPERVLDSQCKWYSDNAPNLVVQKIEETRLLIPMYEKYIEETNDTVINYEQWNEYEMNRRLIAEKLGLEFNDINKENVSKYGKSSYAS